MYVKPSKLFEANYYTITAFNCLGDAKRSQLTDKSDARIEFSGHVLNRYESWPQLITPTICDRAQSLQRSPRTMQAEIASAASS
jgi:hypothetical protein